jgi:Mg-chelatase subunit ChlD
MDGSSVRLRLSLFCHPVALLGLVALVGVAVGGSLPLAGRAAPADAYGLVATWEGVGAATRVVAANDRVYVLAGSGVRKTMPDGSLERTIPAYGLREIAVDGGGILFAARERTVVRIDESGAERWRHTVVGNIPSPLVGEVPPYLAGLAPNVVGEGVTLLYDTSNPGAQINTPPEQLSITLLRNLSLGSGVASSGFPLAFPFQSYWDIDAAAGKAFLLNRSPGPEPSTIEVYRLGGLERVASLPAPAERLAAGPDETLFFLSGRRFVYQVDRSGARIDVWDATDPEPGPVASTATDLAVDAAGRVYVTDPARGQVRVYARQPDVQPGAPPRPEPLDCQTVPNKFAEPTFLQLGERTKVTLRLNGDCPSLAERADILLVVDVSSSMNEADATGRPKIEAARAAVVTFVELMDLGRDQVGLATFESTARLVLGLNQDRQAILAAANGLVAYGGTNIAAGLDVAVQELLGPRRRSDAKPIIVLLTDGFPFVNTRLATVAAGDAARYAGVTVYAIGLGAEVDHNLLRLVARTPQHYFIAPTAVELADVYRQIARRIAAAVLLKRVRIADRVPSNMEYQNDSAVPPAVWDPANRTLTWDFAPVPFAGIEMSYWLLPLQVGQWPTNVSADYDGTDGLDQPQRGPFPVPHVIVVAPGTPTATPINRSPTPRPPTGTPTRPAAGPSPTPVTTATRAPTVTPGPSPTPGRHTIYVIIVFNDQCFQRYTDVVLVIDGSTTMLQRSEDGRLKLDAAKDAARAFLRRLQLTPDQLGRHDQASIVWFNDRAHVAQSLTNDGAALLAAVDRINPIEGSRIDLGLEFAHRELVLTAPRRILANTPAIVLLSDGIPNRTTFEAVYGAADAAKLEAISVYTVGFGRNVRADALRRIASDPSQYYDSPGSAELRSIYEHIAGDLVCR